MNTELEGLLCDSEAARLLPWHLTGRLAAAESVRVAQHLEHCAICREDLADQRGLRNRLRAEGSIEYAPQAGLAATLARIDELGRELGAPERAPERTPEIAPQLAPVAATITPLHGTPRLARRAPRLTQWLAAAVVVQAIGLALVGRALLSQPDASRGTAASYQTLSNNEPAAPGARIRAVFAGAMSTEQLRALLRAQRLSIVAGPTEAGVFTLGIEGPARSTEAALEGLRSDPLVQFAEPARAPGVSPP